MSPTCDHKRCYTREAEGELMYRRGGDNVATGGESGAMQL